MKKNTFLIFDGTNVFIRSFSGLMRQGLTAPNGEGTWGAFGAYNVVSNIIRKYEPSHVLIAFDKGRSSKRLLIDPEYNANRKKDDEAPRNAMDEAFQLEYKPQMSIFMHLCLKSGIPFIRIDNVEADDVISTAALSFAPVFDQVVIVSADHDMQQLIRNNIIVVKPSISYKDIQEERYTTETIMAEWGVEPWRLPEIWALTGDRGDNIKGIRGIGPKKATKMIAEYGNLETLLASDDPKIIDNIEIVRKAYSLIELGIDESIPLPPLGDLQFNPIKPDDCDAGDLEQLYDSLGFVQIKDRWKKNSLWSDGPQFGRRL
jgi:DNA polymerase-1